MSNPIFLALLRKERSDLQVLESAQEIAVFSGALTGVLCVGVWLGSFVSKLDARHVAQVGIGTTMTLVGAAWLGHTFTREKLDKNWETLKRAKQEISSANNTRKCADCKYFSKENKSLLGCAVNPSMPINCPDFESKSQASFQDSSGLNVVIEGCSASEIEEIKAIVNRDFSS